MANTFTTAGVPTTLTLSGIATIENGDQTSAAIPNSGRAVVRLGFPTITSTTVTFQVQAYPQTGAVAASAFRPLVDKDGTAISYTIGSDKIVTIPELSGCAAFKFVMGSNEASTRSIEVTSRGDNPVVSPTEVDVNIESGATITANQGTKTATATNGWLVTPMTAAGTTFGYGPTTDPATLAPFGAGLIVSDTVNSKPLLNAAALNASNGGGNMLPVAAQGYNNTTFEPTRHNIAGTLLASAARTTTTSSPDQTNYNGQAVAVTINITVAPGGDTLTFTIEAKDPVSGAYTTILSSAALATTGTTRLRVGTNITAAANLAAADVIGRTWRVTATASAAGSFTYSVGYDVMTA